jgi:hypothetical protein
VLAAKRVIEPVTIAAGPECQCSGCTELEGPANVRSRPGLADVDDVVIEPRRPSQTDAEHEREPGQEAEKPHRISIAGDAVVVRQVRTTRASLFPIHRHIQHVGVGSPEDDPHRQAIAANGPRGGAEDCAPVCEQRF